MVSTGDADAGIDVDAAGEGCLSFSFASDGKKFFFCLGSGRRGNFGDLSFGFYETANNRFLLVLDRRCKCCFVLLVGFDKTTNHQFIRFLDEKEDNCIFPLFCRRRKIASNVVLFFSC